jgi:hypothetical protein
MKVRGTGVSDGLAGRVEARDAPLARALFVRVSVDQQRPAVEDPTEHRHDERLLAPAEQSQEAHPGGALLGDATLHVVEPRSCARAHGLTSTITRYASAKKTISDNRTTSRVIVSTWKRASPSLPAVACISP